MIAARTLATLSLVLSLASCSDGSDTADASAAPLAATFENVQAVFSRACAFSSCHGSASRPGGGLRLVAGESYAALVRAPSTQVARLMRVAPGDASASWLMIKVEGTLSAVSECRATGNACGVSMPERSELLAASERDLIRRWIAAGAPGPSM